jgi:DNA-binding CsgD family transcriptional regulator
MAIDPTARFAHLVSALGGEDFALRLYAWLQREAAADELFVFRRRFRRDEPPKPMLSLGGRPRTAERTRAYCSSFFRHDPINRLILDGEAASARVDRSEIGPSDYRETCFGRPGLQEKLSLWRRDGDEVTVASLYRTAARRPFGAPEVEALGVCSPLLFALVDKHAALSTRPGAPRLRGEPLIEHLERKLAAMPGRLPPRQLAVCARTVAGMTARGIALELGVGVASVVTHRRRAYERLGVATGAELSALLF